jgi:hypothetical protein
MDAAGKCRELLLMSLDVYVGPLARYYGGDWENVTGRGGQQSTGAASSHSPGQRPAGRNRIRQSVISWRETLSASLGNTVAAPLDWDETEEAPYFVGRPGWDGFGALVLWAAYAEHPAMTLPETLPEEWDNDPALVRSNAEGFRSRCSHLVRNVELWLPIAFDFTFEGESVDRRRIVIGSSATLVRQLADLNAATWKGGPTHLATWARSGSDRDATLEFRARHAFAVVADLAAKALNHRLPMKLDF